MRYQTFGRNAGLRVSEYGLGTGNFGSSDAGDSEAKQVFERFASAGGTLIDTADTYQFGASESLLADLIGADREHFVVATKFGNAATSNRRISNTGNSRRNMVLAVEDSLRRLKTTHIDLYWAHWPDTVTPIDEVVAAFDDLVRSGKILYAGLSNFPAWRVARAATIAELRGLSPVVGIQIEYSLAERTAEREFLPMAEALGLGVALWGPLYGGLLTGKYRRGEKGRLSGSAGDSDPEDTERKARIVDAVVQIASDIGASASQVSMAWLRGRSARSATPFIPIIGPRNLKQLDDYLASLDVDLSEEQYARLDEVSAIPLGVPHEMGAQLVNMVLGIDASRVIRSPIPVP
jgi:aryl-alcohol dehydrogenase-like predicted oxidoreductase